MLKYFKHILLILVGATVRVHWPRRIVPHLLQVVAVIVSLKYDQFLHNSSTNKE